MKEYILEHEKCTIIATYSKGGKLKRLEAKRGFICDAKGHAFAELESDIEHEHWKPYEPEKANAFYKKAVQMWAEFFQKRAGFGYRFSAIDGSSLKSIGKALTEIAGDTEKALELWQYIIINWDTLPDFYRNKPQLNFINAQLNTILNLLKNGKQTSGTAAAAYADDYRQSI